MGERPDIGKMIQEELDKKPPVEKTGETPLEVSNEGKIETADKDIDDAFENIMDKPGDAAADAMNVADLGGEAARKVQVAFEKGDMKNLDAIAKEFVAKAAEHGTNEEDAKAVLRQQLKAYHDTYFEAGLKEKAAEIDSFSRSLESKGDVSTEAGKQFVAKLEAGGFSSIEDAINALDGIKNAAKGADEEQMNAEFNILYAKINEKFLGDVGKDEGQKFDVGDDDIDDALSALG